MSSCICGSLTFQSHSYAVFELFIYDTYGKNMFKKFIRPNLQQKIITFLSLTMYISIYILFVYITLDM